MSDWQERITHETAPAIQAEHELRYRAAAALIGASDVWVDLGCGNGIAAAAALGEARPRRALLVDLSTDLVAGAVSELSPLQARALAGDLTDAVFLESIREQLLAEREDAAECTVTCFEVVEHLESFVPLLEWAGALARERLATFLMSVPNDAFWAMQNPHHRASWGDGAFEELRRLLPDEHTLLRQVALSGSALLAWDAMPASVEASIATGGDDVITTHFLAAFGPRHAELRRGALVTQADALGNRRWQREREAHLASLELLVAEQHEELRRDAVWFTEWREYIHELERKLGLPLSGATPEDLPAASGDGTPEHAEGTSTTGEAERTTPSERPAAAATDAEAAVVDAVSADPVSSGPAA